MSSNNLTEVLRELTKQTLDSANLVNVCFGKVTSTNPLRINVEQRFTLTKEFIVLTKNMTINNEVMDNKLKINDKVVLLRVQGGQKYVVLDKVVR